MTRTALCLALLALAGCAHHPTTARTADQNTELARVQNDAAYNLIAQGKADAAEDILNNALRADPNYGPALNNLGLVAYRKFLRGDGRALYDAARLFDAAIRQMPANPAPRNNLGLVLESANQYREATDQFARAHEMDPDNPEYTGNLARIRWHRGLKDEETRELLRQVIFKDRRPEWVEWARQQLTLIPAPGQDIIPLPTTQP